MLIDVLAIDGCGLLLEGYGYWPQLRGARLPIARCLQHWVRAGVRNWRSAHTDVRTRQSA
ncbi:hypothetical protein C9397_21440 [Xanthomonas vasicola pv. vasculorum]|uniref:Transposase n=2 Tax=Xanthomonas vasicola TaxID=56459 RepID=A0ABD7S914_XANVA|nr:hypothetical protein C7V42_03590 [Xanthomonas vasicola pv. vasculorum]AZR21590.1 hypothetical protein NX81_003620 [Xanthomonas vasicola]AZR28029.1 hypothetical protein NX80_017945 [Xanthomonas vasicola pv. arecae]AZR29753.1 hypothetical protein KWO_003525 [Xanthomonas vasicola pv. musacearum NCPPB 4379]KFA33262.1 hypothetical protein KWI_0121110 [Xanthomonas vasicola pv. vasculorum NCPPB 206]RRJ38299.1 hypothetical protein EIM46_15200 [Xanthomonas vasicola pv. musacearum]